LTKAIEDRFLLEIMECSSNAADAAASLIDAARQNDASDDATCVVAFVEAVAKQAHSGLQQERNPACDDADLAASICQ
jgi:serine/threonine protein phosphatase PrpC